MSNILAQLINDGAPSKAVTLRLGSVSSSATDTFAYQDQHDNFNTNSTIQVDDVDVSVDNPVPTTILSIEPGTGATNIGKAEDAVHSSGDTGVMALAVRNDTLASLVGTDGDYAPLQVNASGALYTTLIPGSDFDSLGKKTGNAATSNDIGVAMMAIRDDALTTLTPADGAYTQLRVDSTGRMHVYDSNIAKTRDAVAGGSDSGIMCLGVRNDTLGALAGSDGDYAPMQISSLGSVYTRISKTHTKVEVFNDIVPNGGVMGKTEIEVPPEVEAMHLFIYSQDSTAQFTFSARYTTGGVDYVSPLLENITLSSISEVHLVTSLTGIPYLVINYSNSSGSDNALLINAVYESYQ